MADLEAMNVAAIAAASWNPFVKVNANANSRAATATRSTNSLLSLIVGRRIYICFLLENDHQKAVRTSGSGTIEHSVASFRDAWVDGRFQHP